MKVHVQYLVRELDGKLHDGLGSDAVYILDGRNRLGVMVKDAMDRWEKLKNVRRFAGFEIRLGDIKRNVTVYRKEDEYEKVCSNV